MDNKKKLKTFYEVVASNGLLDEVPRYVSRGCVIRMGEESIPAGVEGMRNHLAAVRKTYPDLTMTIVRQHCDGDTVVSEFIAEGTHEGEWLGMTPTHKRLTFYGVNVDRLADGLIVEHSGAMNTFEVLFQENIIQSTPK